MSVRKLANQAAEHDSGVIVSSADREADKVQYLGQQTLIDVDRGVGSISIYIPDEPVWADGTAISAQTMELIKTALVEVNACFSAELGRVTPRHNSLYELLDG